MYYSLTRRELKGRNGTGFKDGDTVSISDSHYEIWIKFGGFERPSLCSKVFDLSKGRFQDVVFRQNYIRDFLSR